MTLLMNIRLWRRLKLLLSLLLSKDYQVQILIFLFQILSFFKIFKLKFPYKSGVMTWDINRDCDQRMNYANGEV